MNWHTRIEKSTIRKLGGTPYKKSGTDGILRGRPVEVRCIRKDNRFRIQKNVHKEMVAKNGRYIFVNSRRDTKILPAKSVSKKIGNGEWLKDRKYPHKFINKKDVFI